MGWKVSQTWSFRGSKSRNKVSVGEPAEGSLNSITDYICKYMTVYYYIPFRVLFFHVASARQSLQVAVCSGSPFFGEPAVGEISSRKVNYKSNYVFILCLNRSFFFFFKNTKKNKK